MIPRSIRASCRRAIDGPSSTSSALPGAAPAASLLRCHWDGASEWPAGGVGSAAAGGISTRSPLGNNKRTSLQSLVPRRRNFGSSSIERTARSRTRAAYERGRAGLFERNVWGGLNALNASTAGTSRITSRRSLLTRAYAEGPDSPALLPHTIPEHFAETVRKYGDRTAVISRHQNKRLTFKELDELSDVLAGGLREVNGVKKGDRVCVMLGNNWEFAVLTYAVFKLGAILVPLNPAFTSKQVISALTHLTAAHLVISIETKLPYKAPRSNVPLLEDLIPGLSSSLSPPSKLDSHVLPSLKSVILVDNSSGRISTHRFKSTTPFTSLFSSKPTSQSESVRKIVPDEPLQRDEIINIQFTSGTTSSPKAACLTHRSILNNGFFIGERMGLKEGDVVACPPPLFHCFGSVLGYMATVTAGAAILFPDEAFNPEATLRAIQEEKATALYGVATMFIAELELLANGTVPHEGFQYLRTGIAAGSSVPASLMSRLHSSLNLTGLTICYGMTETSPVSCMTTPFDPIEKRINTVGKLMPHTVAKVVDVTDRNRILGVGEKGELVVSGYLVMKGYWGDEARTNEVLFIEGAAESDPTCPAEEVGSDGQRQVRWMHTGDEATIDSEGYVSITGRIKDLIIRGGENIHPLEIENVVFGMEGVREVSVVGLPDDRLGEGVAAFVVVREGWTGRGGDGSWEEEGFRESSSINGSVGGKDGEGKGKVLEKEDVRAWVKQRLSGHLVPKWVFWVREYPKTASGKIQKFKLQEMGAEMLKRKGGK